MQETHGSSNGDPCSTFLCLFGEPTPTGYPVGVCSPRLPLCGEEKNHGKDDLVLTN